MSDESLTRRSRWKKYPALDMKRLLNDHGISFVESHNGWLQLKCPFCYRGDGARGLGWSGTVFSCFRCGRLRLAETLVGILGKNIQDAVGLLRKYQTPYTPGKESFSVPNPALERNLTCLSMPKGVKPLLQVHKSYLSARKYDPDALVRRYGLLGTGPAGDLPLRLVAPVVMDGRQVCWQARDITDRAPAKYRSCPDDKAVTPIKQCLYGLDDIPGDTVVITEGVTKVWRLGPGSVGTFGATVTTEQIRLLSRFKHRVILFDDDVAGRLGAEKLSGALSVLSGSTSVVWIEGVRDAADLSQADAKELMLRAVLG